MSTSKPFLFDHSFDLSAIKAEEEAKAVKTYTEEEVALIKEQAYGQGFIAGKDVALTDLQTKQSGLLANTNRLLERLAADVWQVYAQQKQTASDIALAIVRKLLPEYTRKHGTQEMTAVIEQSIAEMINEPRLVLRVNEQHFDYVKREVDAMAERLGYLGKMIILADPQLGENDCRLEWADGGMERNTSLTWSEIERQVARHAGAGQMHAPVTSRTNEPQPPTTTIAV